MQINRLDITEFSVCYISTIALPFNFSEEDIDKHKNYIDKISNNLRSFFCVDEYKTGRQCWKKAIKGENENFKRSSCKCFYHVDNFLKSLDIKEEYYCERLHVLQFFLENKYRVDIILSLYYRLGYANVIVNATTKDNHDNIIFTVDDIIRIKELLSYTNCFSSYNRKEEKNLPNNEGFKNFQKKISELSGAHLSVEKEGMVSIKKLSFEFARFLQYFILHETYDKKSSLADKKAKILFEDQYKIKEYCHNITEIKCIKSKQENIINDGFLNKYSHDLYGILTCDEGYPFVPHEVAINALKHSWGTRYFNKGIMFGDSMLILNIKPKSYIDFQTQQCEKIFIDRNNDYFTVDSCIAGLDHCFLENVEKACLNQYAIRRVLSKKVVSPTNKNTTYHIDETHELRQDILKVINKSYLSAKELNVLLRIIYTQKGIFTEISDLKYKLERNNDELIFLYSIQENMTLRFLTIATVITAFIVGFFTLNERPYKLLCMVLPYLIIAIVCICIVCICIVIRHSLQNKRRRRTPR